MHKTKAHASTILQPTSISEVVYIHITTTRFGSIRICVWVGCI